MGFLKKVNIAASEYSISLEEIYSGDPQFQELVDLSIDILSKLAHKFNMSDKKIVDLFVKQIQKGM